MTLTVSSEHLRAEALVERMFLAGVGAFELLCVHLGHRLGLYRALAELGAATPTRLAEKSGVSARYAREWLEQQAVAGLLSVTDAGADADERRYRLPDAYVDVLVDRRASTTPSRSATSWCVRRNP